MYLMHTQSFGQGWDDVAWILDNGVIEDLRTNRDSSRNGVSGKFGVAVQH